jgi:hypothetical protein
MIVCWIYKYQINQSFMKIRLINQSNLYRNFKNHNHSWKLIQMTRLPDKNQGVSNQLN